ncbi:MAG: M13-type metalloendopeptidase [Gemmatimonadota bacterium]
MGPGLRPPTCGILTIRRTSDGPEAIRSQVQANEHAPAPFRVNGPLPNMPEFAKAFGCQPGDPMVRTDSVRAQIW